MPAKAKMQAKTKLHQLFCERLKARRIQLGLTQQAAAALLDVSQPAYAQLESGKWTPTLTQIEIVATAFEISAEELLSQRALVGA